MFILKFEYLRGINGYLYDCIGLLIRFIDILILSIFCYLLLY